MRAFLMALSLSIALLAGCSDDPAPPVEPGPAEPPLPRDTATTWYHMSEARAINHTALGVNNTIIAAHGDYSPIGHPSFEPTMGVTSSGNLFFASFREDGLLQYTHIIRSTDHGVNWTNMGPFLGPTDMPVVPNSNDPYIFVDAWTDRVYKVDMCATLAGFCVEFSDDEGETWLVYPIATGGQPAALDHQSFAAAPKTGEVPSGVYTSNLVFCVNRGPNIAGSWCSSSIDGGISWLPMLPGYPVGKAQCFGLHGHIAGSMDGRFYRGGASCDGVGVWRSDDGGLTWSEHAASGHQVLGHEVAVEVDESGNVYAFWVNAEDGLPYMAASSDLGATWTPARMVAPPGVTAAGFPTVAAGAQGRVAWAYIGTTVAEGYSGEASEMAWNGYIGSMTDAFAADPVITSVAVNAADDPLDAGRACGRIRCGGFGDFIDIVIDPAGRPYVAFAHNAHSGQGIVGTVEAGWALRGDLAALPALDVPGPAGFA